VAHLGAFAGAATVSSQTCTASVVQHKREQVIVVVDLGGPEQWRSRNSAPHTLIRRDRRHLLGGEHDPGRSTGLFGGRHTASCVRDSPSGDDTAGTARSTLRSWSAPTVRESSEARTVHRVTILTDRSIRFSREAATTSSRGPASARSAEVLTRLRRRDLGRGGDLGLTER
jgi:hypothetical protein